MIIFAGTKGYLDEVPVDQVLAWEAGFYRYMDANHPEIGQEIIEKSVRAKNKMTPELLDKLGKAIDEYKKTAAPQSGGQGVGTVPQAQSKQLQNAQTQQSQTTQAR